jgi:hypothetical protein
MEDPITSARYARGPPLVGPESGLPSRSTAKRLKGVTKCLRLR